MSVAHLTLLSPISAAFLLGLATFCCTAEWSKSQLETVGKAIDACAQPTLSDPKKRKEKFMKRPVAQLICGMDDSDPAISISTSLLIFFKSLGHKLSVPQPLADFFECLRKAEHMPEDLDDGLLNWLTLLNREVIGSNCEGKGFDTETVLQPQSTIFNAINFDPGRKLKMVSINRIANALVANIDRPGAPAGAHYCSKDKISGGNGNLALLKAVKSALQQSNTAAVLLQNFEKLKHEFTDLLDGEKICGKSSSSVFKMLSETTIANCPYPLLVLLSGDKAALAKLTKKEIFCRGPNELILLISNI